MRSYKLLFAILVLFTFVVFVFDILLGSVNIPISDLFSYFTGGELKPSWLYIINNLRIPKAITALFVGAGISICGLQMQTMFRNPLADTSILGIGNGASLGVALFVMTGSVFSSFISVNMVHSYWNMIIAAVLGAFFILLVISYVANWLRDMVALLVVGVMIGFIISSIVSVLQFFTNPETLKQYVIWTFGSLSGTTWEQLHVMMPVVGVAILISLFMPKSMNAMLLGDNYAQSVGVNVFKVRIILISLTGIITGALTAFVGPIAFVGIAVPHVARLLFKTSDNKILLPATLILGALLMMVCDIISQLPGTGIVLPINSVTSVFGAPIVVFIIMKNRKRRMA